MNAVNLIPQDSRRAGPGLKASPPTLGLIGGLVLVLIGTILYVTSANTVTTRSRQLARLDSGVQEWTAAAGGLTPFVTAAQQRESQLSQVRVLVGSRFPWSDLLSQIGTLMPAAAQLSSLQATTASSATSSTTTGTSPAATASSATVPSVQLQGCARDQATVAQTMTQLRTIHGVSAVTLASTSTAGTGSSGDSSSSGCGSSPALPVQFQLSLTFSAATPPAATSSSAPTTSSTTPQLSSTPGTPEAATGSDGSGAAAQ